MAERWVLKLSILVEDLVVRIVLVEDLVARTVLVEDLEKGNMGSNLGSYKRSDCHKRNYVQRGGY